jgi:putative flavoprotein involved in K+ transport
MNEQENPIPGRRRSAMNTRKMDTVIVGGGQAGLAISYYLKQQGQEHVVLERAPAIANAWRNQRWDSFTLVTPNFQVRMPGAEYRGDDPYGFMSRAEVVKYLDDYAAGFGLPVRCGVEVTSVEKSRQGYVVRMSEGNYEAKNVVIATGLYQSPKFPQFSAAIPPDILQMHSMEYRNPTSLPEGAVLVVGTDSRGPRLPKNCTRAGVKSISRSAARDACPGDIAAGTSTIGLLAWGCSIRKLAN